MPRAQILSSINGSLVLLICLKCINHVSVTEAGLFSLYGLGLLDLIPLEATFKLPGDFYGLEVLGQYSEDQVILTTQMVLGFTVVNMIGEN